MLSSPACRSTRGRHPLERHLDAVALARAAGLVLVAYLSGSIPVGVLVARAAGGPDPRTIGSGRTGGTNALRALGRRWALVVVLGDVAKGVIPVLLTTWLDGDPVVVSLCGLAAVLGASRSIFLRFHGGRGIGTGVGTMLAIEPLAVLLAAPVFVGVIAVTGYVSLGSLLGSAAVVPLMALVWWALGEPFSPVYIGYVAVGAALIWIAHSDNIARLLSGTERKLDLSLLTRDGPR
ncbi:MAG TPA: glycerol-3-phosphate 1-O-acyltransferase PlsY [Candidatus Dormibacteraeota bacterium]|nr:glycerol-3-phosphate 1-O-acyltransferase PlsY [Candidatus Dormibacteraeota bacterium]